MARQITEVIQNTKNRFTQETMKTPDCLIISEPIYMALSQEATSKVGSGRLIRYLGMEIIVRYDVHEQLDIIVGSKPINEGGKDEEKRSY